MTNGFQEKIRSVFSQSLRDLLLHGFQPLDEAILLEKQMHCSIQLNRDNNSVDKSILSDLYKDWEVQYEKELSYYNDNLFSRIEEVASEIRKDSQSRKLYFNFWGEKGNDPSAQRPCLVGLNFRVLKDSKLDMHVIMRANNAFKIFPINVVIFLSFFFNVAKKVDLTPNTYHHYSSLFHLYKADVNDLKHSDFFLKTIPDDLRLIPLP